ncbi:MAG: hypothetical protein ACLR7U_03485 [Ruthenibacterium lactatiformans]
MKPARTSWTKRHESVAAHRIADVMALRRRDSSYIAAVLMPDTTFSVGLQTNSTRRTTRRAGRYIRNRQVIRRTNA